MKSTGHDAYYYSYSFKKAANSLVALDFLFIESISKISLLYRWTIFPTACTRFRQKRRTGDFTLSYCLPSQRPSSDRQRIVDFSENRLRSLYSLQEASGKRDRKQNLFFIIKVRFMAAPLERLRLQGHNKE